MEIPYEQLQAEVLHAIIEEFVLQEGTDYGHADYSLEQKVSAVRQQLKSGMAVVVFDEEEESCFIKQIVA